jgi:gliding motility-associated-like protein
MKGTIVLLMRESCRKVSFLNQYVIKLCNFIFGIEVKKIMNNLKFYITLSFIILASICFSQNQNNIWYFGLNAGLNFNTIPPTALNDGVLTHAEGVGSVCDINGDLLFFTNGLKVWDANKRQMPNGFGLLGDNSSSQTIIVPKPGDCTIYYIFTMPSQSNTDSLCYTEVDMKLNGGFGDVTSRNKGLAKFVTERITATLKSNGIDYWVVAQSKGSHDFLVYSVTALGVSTTPIVSFTGAESDSYSDGDAIGCMKISPDGKKLSYAVETGHKKCYLYDFNNQTGVVSNGFILYNEAAYGVEFSNDNSKLYLSRYNPFKLIQFDLSSNIPSAIQNSAFTISNLGINEYGGALQRGPNNKIYVARANKAFLDLIDNPNLLNSNCNYIPNSVSLNNNLSFAGLPNLINNYSPVGVCGGLKAEYIRTTLCGGNNVTISVTATFGTAPYLYSIDGINFQSNNTFTNLNSGNYKITVKDANLNISFVYLNIPLTNTLSLTSSNIIQPNCGFSDGSVTLLAVNGQAPFTYSQDGTNFQTSNVFSGLNATTINFIVKDQNGCIDSKIISLDYKSTLKIDAGNFTTFVWSPSYGLSDIYSQNPIATIDKDIDYTITATNALGCIAVDKIHIDVYKEIGIFVPTAFSPNNDGRNDILKAIPRGIKQLFYFRIFDRYGKQIFYTTNFNIGWDGKIQGINQNTNTYIWIAEGVDINGKVVNRKGTFTLIR